MKDTKENRRIFLRKAGVLAASTTFLSPSVQSFSNIIIPNKQDKLGVALVGLGYYSRDLLAPALQLTSHCELRGIVTGSAEKVPIWQKKYGIKDSNVYNYDNMHEIANNADIDIIYIVLPTSLHSRYAIIAANCGKHVWCEKPMARSVSECQSIISASQKNKVKLSIGYRMHHEPNTQTIMQWAKSKPYGDITATTAEAGYYDGRTNHWKQRKSMGGGALYDMGVYSINGLRYANGKEPIAVVNGRHETARPQIYSEVDETTYFTLEFPDGVMAKGATSFGHGWNTLHVDAQKGWYALSPFQSYSGIRGTTSDGKYLNSPIPNQQARQMDNDALSIINNTDVLVPGKEGLKDIQIVEAIYKSAKENRRIDL